MLLVLFVLSGCLEKIKSPFEEQIDYGIIVIKKAYPADVGVKTHTLYESFPSTYFMLRELCFTWSYDSLTCKLKDKYIGVGAYKNQPVAFIYTTTKESFKQQVRSDWIEYKPDELRQVPLSIELTQLPRG